MFSATKCKLIFDTEGVWGIVWNRFQHRKRRRKNLPTVFLTSDLEFLVTDQSLPPQTKNTNTKQTRQQLPAASLLLLANRPNERLDQGEHKHIDTTSNE